MKVTIFCEVLGQENNGTTIAAMNLIRHLKSKGHQVTVICPDQDKKGQEGYVVLPIKHFGFIIDSILKRNGIVTAKFDYDLIYNAMKDADIIHFMVPLFIAKKASKLAKSLNKPITAGFHAQAENLTSHIFMKNCRLANHLTYKFYNNNLFTRVDAIHYPTQFIRDLFEKEIHKRTNGYVISNGVNNNFKPLQIEKSSLLKNKFCILFIGRFSKEKSHMVLLKAVKLSKHEKDIQLLFAGIGPTKNKVVKYGKKHLTNQPIIDFYSRDELISIINQCDLYCHPSEVEIEAISCLEAIACGLVPIISDSPRSATKAFAIDKMCLFNCNNSQDLANKIDYFIDNPQELSDLRNKYLKESERFEQTYCMDLMEQMLKEVVLEKEKENG